MHVSPFLPRFMAEFPGVELDLLISDEVVNLVERRVDVAVRLGALILQPDCAQIGAASADRLRQPGLSGTAGRRAPGDLADHACLTFAFADGERRWRFTMGERIEQIRVKARCAPIRPRR
jgi:DNA-binding transcriptional LysR family regulator